jgi:uncharacterized membrane protein
MKKTSSIIGTNLIVLFISIILLSTIKNPSSNFVYFIPVFVLVGFNIIKSCICFYNGDTSKAKTFILSSILILIIGGSSCVTIKFKSKPPQQKSKSTIQNNEGKIME